MLEILSHSNKKMSELLDGVNKYYSTEELRIHVDDDKKFDIVDKVKEYVKEKNYKYLDLDGVRVQFDDGWALVRASNTGPNLTIRFEANSELRLTEIQKEFTDLVNNLIA